MVIEQWATHIVVIDYTGRLKVFYDAALFSSCDPPKVLWTRPIPPGEPVWRSGSLKVVLYQGCITCWAVDGLFECRIPPERVARDEYVLVSVLMKDEALKPYRTAWDKPSDDPEIRVAQHHWIRHYEHVGPEENFRWNLVINDVVARVTGVAA